MQLNLTIRGGGSRQRATAAWFVPGRKPATWLAELAKWHVDLAQVVLRAVPRSAHDRTPLGLLVTLPADWEPHVSPRCEAYGVVAGRLFLPVNARLEPPLRESEIADLLGGNSDQYAMHPVAGLVRFEAADLRTGADLLQPPVRSCAGWDCARSATPVGQRLLSVEPEVEYTSAAMLERGRDGIATEEISSGARPGFSATRAASLTEPAIDAGTGTGYGARGVRIVQGLVAPLATLVAALAALLRPGRSAKRRSARRRRGPKQTPPAPFATDRADDPPDLRRLLDLLKSDPDRGLRHAVPLSGKPGPRVRETRSSLPHRKQLDFDLDQLLRGRPAGAIAVVPGLYDEFRRLYRKLANRELQLGRYRRAAFIFAHLLDDLEAAASALCTGGHWREAAMLYRDYLHQERQAAECLEQGEYWTEAIDLYRQVPNFEKIGDIYRIIDRPEEATQAYRAAVQRCLTFKDYRGAARLLETSLDAKDEALQWLARGWPGSHQARACLSAMVHIYATTGRHADAIRLVEQGDAETLARPEMSIFMDQLADMVRTYPDRLVREKAADRACVIASHVLGTAPASDAQAVLGQLASVKPHDRLFARDCYRYGNWHTRPSQQVARHFIVRPLRLHLVWKWNLPNDTRWISAHPTQHAVYFVGYRQDALCITRWPWERDTQKTTTVRWPVAAETIGSPVVICGDWFERWPALVHVVGAAPLVPESALDVSTPGFDHSLFGMHHHFTARTVGAARSPDGLTWLVQRESDHLLLCTYSADQDLLGSHVLAFPPSSVGAPHMAKLGTPMAVSRDSLMVACGHWLLALERGKQARLVQASSHIEEITLAQANDKARGVKDDLADPLDATESHHPSRAAYAILKCEQSLAILSYKSHASEPVTLKETSLMYACGVVGARRLAVYDGDYLEIYRPWHDTEYSQPISVFRHRFPDPIAVVRGRQPNQFLVANRDGEVQLLRSGS